MKVHFIMAIFKCKLLILLTIKEYIVTNNPDPVPDELIVSLKGYTRKPIFDISNIPE